MMRGDAAPPSHAAAKLRSALHRSRSLSQMAEAHAHNVRPRLIISMYRAQSQPTITAPSHFFAKQPRPAEARTESTRRAAQPGPGAYKVDAVDRSLHLGRGRPRSAGGGGASFGREDRHQHLGRTVRPRGQYHALPLDFDPGLKPRPDVSAIRKRMHRDVAAFRPPVVYDARYGKSKAEAAPDRRRAREQQMRALNHPPGPGPAAYDHQLWRPWSAASYKSGTNWSWHDRPEVGEAQQRELGHTNFNAGSRGGLTTAERAAASSRPSSAATLRAPSPPLTPPSRPFSPTPPSPPSPPAALPADAAAAVGAALRKAVELGHALTPAELALLRRAAAAAGEWGASPSRRSVRELVVLACRGGRPASASAQSTADAVDPRARGGWLHGPSGRASAVVGATRYEDRSPGPAAHDPRPGSAATRPTPTRQSFATRPREHPIYAAHNHDSTLVAHVSRASLDPGSDGRAVAAASAFSGPELLEVRNLRRRVRAGRMLYESELALLRRYVEAKREELGEEAAVR